MFLGVALALAFVMLASLAATLGRLIISEAAYTRARRVVLYAVAALAAVALPRTVSGARVFHFSELAVSFRCDRGRGGSAGPVRGLQQRHARRAMVPRLARLGRRGGGDRPGLAGAGLAARCRLSRVVHGDQPAGLPSSGSACDGPAAWRSLIAEAPPDSGSHSSPGWAAPAPSPGGNWSSRAAPLAG